MCTSEGVSGLSECDCVCVRLPACCNHCPGHGAPALTSSPCSVPDNKNIAIRHSPSGTPVFPPTSPLRHRGVTPMPCLRAPPPLPSLVPSTGGEGARERGCASTHTRTHGPGPTPFQHSTPRVLACADHTTPATDWLDCGCLLLPCAGQHTSWQPHAYCRSLSAVVSACCPAMCMFVYVFQQFACVSVC